MWPTRTPDPLDQLEGMAESCGSDLGHVRNLSACVVDELESLDAREEDQPLIKVMALVGALVQVTRGDDDLLNMAVELIDVYVDLEEDDIDDPEESDESES